MVIQLPSVVATWNSFYVTGLFGSVVAFFLGFPGLVGLQKTIIHVISFGFFLCSLLGGLSSASAHRKIWLRLALVHNSLYFFFVSSWWVWDRMYLLTFNMFDLIWQGIYVNQLLDGSGYIYHVGLTWLGMLCGYNMGKHFALSTAFIEALDLPDSMQGRRLQETADVADDDCWVSKALFTLMFLVFTAAGARIVTWLRSRIFSTPVVPFDPSPPARDIVSITPPGDDPFFEAGEPSAELIGRTLEAEPLGRTLEELSDLGESGTLELTASIDEVMLTEECQRASGALLSNQAECNHRFAQTSAVCGTDGYCYSVCDELQCGAGDTDTVWSNRSISPMMLMDKEQQTDPIGCPCPLREGQHNSDFLQCLSHELNDHALSTDALGGIWQMRIDQERSLAVVGHWAILPNGAIYRWSTGAALLLGPGHVKVYDRQDESQTAEVMCWRRHGSGNSVCFIRKSKGVFSAQNLYHLFKIPTIPPEPALRSDVFLTGDWFILDASWLPWPENPLRALSITGWVCRDSEDKLLELHHGSQCALLLGTALWRDELRLYWLSEQHQLWIYEHADQRGDQTMLT